MRLAEQRNHTSLGGHWLPMGNRAKERQEEQLAYETVDQNKTT